VQPLGAALFPPHIDYYRVRLDSLFAALPGGGPFGLRVRDTRSAFAQSFDHLDELKGGGESPAEDPNPTDTGGVKRS
jgi:hypothetical protein